MLLCDSQLTNLRHRVIMSQVDGMVLSGQAVADEAMLTGEAALVPKRTGDRVSRSLQAYCLRAQQLPAAANSLVAGGRCPRLSAMTTAGDSQPLAACCR